MARKPAATVNEDGTPKTPRVLGPRKLYLVLKEGSDLASIRSAIELVTFNGRKMVDLVSNGDTPRQVLSYTIEVDKRGPQG